MRLGTAPWSASVPGQARRAFVLRRAVVRHHAFLAWTIDDELLFELVPPPERLVCAGPVGHEGVTGRLGVNHLRTLLDEVVDPEWGTSLPGGRVVLAWCSVCWGQGCPVLAADLTVRGEWVVWDDVRWQSARETTPSEPGQRWAFARDAYEELLERLLVEEQLRLRSAR